MANDNVDYRAFYDATYLRAWDLPAGRDAVVTISRVEQGVIKGTDKEDRRPIVFFEGKKKGLVLNKGMGKTIKGMYGRFTKDWIGREIAIYATTTQAFGETHDVLRVRPEVPSKRRAANPRSPAPALPPSSEVQDAEFKEADSQEVAS